MTEPLFDSEPYRAGKRKRKSVKSAAQGKCPCCTAPRIGLIRAGYHLVWRDHWYRTWDGVAVLCMSSGVSACHAPERKPLDPRHPVRCPHE